MVIVITGLDGSGTSSIAKKLNEMDEGSYLFKTPDPMFINRKDIDTIVKNESVTANMLFYMASNVYISDYIKNHCDYKNRNVYIVRYLIDTVVSNRVAGLDIELDYNVYGNQLLKPDLTLFINVDEKIRQERITKRGKDCLDRILDSEDNRNKFLEEFESNLDSSKTIYVCNDSELDKVVIDTFNKIKKYQNNVIK